MVGGLLLVCTPLILAPVTWRYFQFSKCTMFSYNSTPLLFSQNNVHLFCEANIDTLELNCPLYSVFNFIIAHIGRIDISSQLNCEILEARVWVLCCSASCFPSA